MTTSAATLLDAQKAFVIAPAGCGKTQLIAEAVTLDSSRRSLILTHTHAGVDALRMRLRKLGATTSAYCISTIAGWSLRLVLSFPRTSGITTQRPTDDEWNAVYVSTVQLLSVEAIRAVVAASFDAVYVDEYQDCSLPQHDVVLKLASVLPTRILGDPLQGIFDFAEPVVDWETDVRPHFAALPPLERPYRWEKKNPALGEWLMMVRGRLERGEPIDVSQAPLDAVRYVRLPDDQREHWQYTRELIKNLPRLRDQTTLVIHRVEQQCHATVRATSGRFRSPETMECKDLFKYAAAFDQAENGGALARLTFEFASLCLTAVGPELQDVAKRVFDGRGLQKGREYKRQAQLDALSEIASVGSFAAVRAALSVLARTPNANTVRHELFTEMLKALEEWETGRHRSLEEAAMLTRERTRLMGRAPGHNVVSRTLLIKGLEFDNVVVLDAHAFDRKNLYVALTRASRHLTVVSQSPILCPK